MNWRQTSDPFGLPNEQWAVELTWPNNGREIVPRSTRELAQSTADWHNNSGQSVCTARVMRRKITIGPWTGVPT